MYLFYLKRLLPIIGWIISGNYDAYKYLSDTIIGFPSPNNFIDELINSGFNTVYSYQLSDGIVQFYIAKKRSKGNI